MIVAEYANTFFNVKSPFLLSPDSPASADGCTATLSNNTPNSPKWVCSYANDKQAAFQMLSCWNYFIESLKM